MNHLIESIVNKDHTTSKELFEQHMNQLMNEKLDEVKKMIAARIDEQITVNKDGKVHTAAGEEILPSVYRARRQLAEDKAKIKLKPGKTTQKDISKAKKRIEARKAKKEAKFAPGMTPERKEELRKKSEEAAAKRAKRKANAVENAKKAKMAEMKREAEKIAKAAGVSVKRAAQVIKGEKIDKPVEKTTGSQPRPKPVGYNNWSTLKKLAFNAREKIESKLGLKEEALARAKAIVEEKPKVPSMGTGSTPPIGKRTSTIEIKNPEGQKETIIAGSEARSSGRAKKGRKLARKLGAKWKRPGTYETNI